MKNLIAPTTSAVSSDSFTVEYNDKVTLVAFGLEAGEVIYLQMTFLEPSNGSYTDVYDYDTEEKITLKPTRNVIPISVPGVYRVYKPVTVGTVSVGMHETRN